MWRGREMFSEWLEDLKSFYDSVLTPELVADLNVS